MELLLRKIVVLQLPFSGSEDCDERNCHFGCSFTWLRNFENVACWRDEPTGNAL